MNLLSVLCAAVAVFFLGGLWYSPLLFLNAWLRESGQKPVEKHGPKPFLFSFVFSFISALLFSLFAPHSDLMTSLGSGLVIGVGWVATSFGINYQFSGRSLTILAIDGGYHIAQFLIYGLIIGAWPKS